MLKAVRRWGLIIGGKNLFIIWNLFFGISAVAAQPALKEVFKDHFLVGAALNEFHFTQKDVQGAALVKQHFNSITPENVLKWEHVHPGPNRYDFSKSDAFVEFGTQNNMVVIGHTLIWYNQTPQWVFEDDNGKEISKERLLERMRDHIHTVVGRYKGKIKGWDVVNEAVLDDGSYNNSKWLQILGEEYLVKAFQFVHEADPDAELYYNDFSVENILKRNGVIRLVKMLQSHGVNISGIGMQGHYLLHWPSTGLIDSTIKEFASLGVKVMVTELDIDILPQPDQTASAEITRTFAYREKLNPYKNGLPEETQHALAKRYEDIFSVLVRNSDDVDRVTFWGVEDGSSWLNGFPVRGRTNYPLLFSRNYKTKPAFDAVVQIIK